MVPTEFTEFVCVLLICEYQCHLWEDIFRWTVLCVPRVLWAFFSPTDFTLSFTSHRFHGFTQMVWVRYGFHGIHGIWVRCGSHGIHGIHGIWVRAPNL